MLSNPGMICDKIESWYFSLNVIHQRQQSIPGFVLFTFFNSLLWLLQPVLTPLCFVLAWGFILMLLWTIISAGKSAIKQGQTMRQIPCPNCQFFTNDHRLKCTIQPMIANTEQAIYCQDYSPRSGLN